MYRPDIDGLRAIAVLAVVFYHVRIGLFHGGFIGVDVFFVISGYLITGLIVDDAARARFSIVRFYERRVRRIFPALFAMLLTVSAAAAFLLLPSELTTFGHSLLATTLFASNIFFAGQAGYFAPDAVNTPLLHTWSLAVEEQFYVVFPLVVVFLVRFLPRHLKGIIGATAALSLLSAIVLTKANPTVAFYSSPTRAWELLLGSLLALQIVRVPARRWIAEAAGVAGLFFVLGSALLLRDSLPFPGALALAPTIGAALLIWSGAECRTLVSKLLSIAPIVFIGLISYSLYLWHWPIIVLTRLAIDHDLTKPFKVAVLVASVAIAVLSWHFVERPFRRSTAGGRMRIAGMSGAAILASAGLAVVLIAFAGFPNRFSSYENRVLSFIDYKAEKTFGDYRCFLIDGPLQRFDFRECLRTQPGAPNALLLGDSHAADLGVALAATFPGVHLLSAAATGCKPLLDTPGREPCVSLMQSVLKDRLAELRPAFVILSADWSSSDIGPLQRTVAYLASLHEPVYVFGPVPEYELPLPRLLTMSLRNTGRPMGADALLPQGRETDDAFAAALAASPARYVSLYRMMCPAEGCVTQVEPGVPMQFDTNHFTAQGALWVCNALKQSGVMREAAPGTKAVLRTIPRMTS